MRAHGIVIHGIVVHGIVVHGIVFYDSNTMDVLDNRVYIDGRNRYERKIIKEFLNFGKTLIKKIDTSLDEVVISLLDDKLLVYITVYNGVGLAMMLSGLAELDGLPHLVSKKLINSYLSVGDIPEQDDILHWFKHRETLSDIGKTKKVLLRTISKVIERGETIDNLIEQTDSLSKASKVFLKSSRRLRGRCCFFF